MNKNNNDFVYVVDKKGRVLDPTRRRGKVRRLLKSGEAVAINNDPFVIKLKREATGPTRNYILGIDPGRENIGLAVSDEKGRCVFKAEVETKNKSVTKAVSERSEHRKERRRHRRSKRQRRAREKGTEIKNGKDDLLKSKTPCKSVETSYPGMEEKTTQKVIRGKEARFNNRKRPEGWLTPSGNQLIQMHLESIEKVLQVLPVSTIIFEANVFDFQKLENPDIKGEEYQHGRLFGFNSVFDYVFKRQNGLCPLCGGPIETLHHLTFSSQEGSNSVDNIVGLCSHCHEGLVHKDEKIQKLLKAYKQGIRKKYSVSLLNSVMPKLLEEVSKLCGDKNLSFKRTTGVETKLKREMYGLEKSHCNDAFSISLGECPPDQINSDSPCFYYRRFKKKSSNIISKTGSREYFDREERVAINRHKAMTQTNDSLEELRENYLKTHSKREWDDYFRNLKVVPAKRVYTFHKTGQVVSFHPGDTIKFERRLKSGKIKYSGVSAVTGISASQNLVHTASGKHPNYKYCSYLSGGSLACLGRKT